MVFGDFLTKKVSNLEELRLEDFFFLNFYNWNNVLPLKFILDAS